MSGGKIIIQEFTEVAATLLERFVKSAPQPPMQPVAILADGLVAHGKGDRGLLDLMGDLAVGAIHYDPAASHQILTKLASLLQRKTKEAAAYDLLDFLLNRESDGQPITAFGPHLELLILYQESFASRTKDKVNTLVERSLRPANLDNVQLAALEFLRSLPTVLPSSQVLAELEQLRGDETLGERATEMLERTNPTTAAPHTSET